MMPMKYMAGTSMSISHSEEAGAEAEAEADWESGISPSYIE
jgi:hypothetical protein